MATYGICNRFLSQLRVTHRILLFRFTSVSFKNQGGHFKYVEEKNSFIFPRYGHGSNTYSLRMQLE